MHTRSRNQKRENMQFQSEIVAISGFQDLSPNGSATRCPFSQHFPEEKRTICDFHRKYMYSATSRPDLWRGIGFSQEIQTFCFRSTLRTTAWRPPLQTVCFRSTLRPIILRIFPTAAAEWAKPREIRRGYSPKRPKERESPYGV